jgi:hypothetical protein
MIGLADKLEHVHGSVDVGQQRVPQVGIEIREPRAVDDQVEILAQPVADRGRKAKAGLGNIAFNHFDAFSEETRQPRAMPRPQGIKDR